MSLDLPVSRSCATVYRLVNARVNWVRIGFPNAPLIRTALEERQLPERRIAGEMARSCRKVPLQGEHTDPFDLGATVVTLSLVAARHNRGSVLNAVGGLECAPV